MTGTTLTREHVQVSGQAVNQAGCRVPSSAYEVVASVEREHVLSAHAQDRIESVTGASEAPTHATYFVPDAALPLEDGRPAASGR